MQPASSGSVKSVIPDYIRPNPAYPDASWSYFRMHNNLVVFTRTGCIKGHAAMSRREEQTPARSPEVHNKIPQTTGLELIWDFFFNLGFFFGLGRFAKLLFP